MLSAVAISRTDDVLAGGGASTAQGLTEGFQAAFLGGAAIAALGFVLTLVLIRGRDSRAHMELGDAAATESA